MHFIPLREDKIRKALSGISIINIVMIISIVIEGTGIVKSHTCFDDRIRVTRAKQRYRLPCMHSSIDSEVLKNPK